MYGQKIILKRDTLDIVGVPFLSPHTLAPCCKEKSKDTKTGLPLAKLLDIIILKETYTLKRERDGQWEML